MVQGAMGDITGQLMAFGDHGWLPERGTSKLSPEGYGGVFPAGGKKKEEEFAK